MSWTCYNIYVYEVPDLYKLVNDPIFNKITNTNTKFNYTGIQHELHNYIARTAVVLFWKNIIYILDKCNWLSIEKNDHLFY